MSRRELSLVSNNIDCYHKKGNRKEGSRFMAAKNDNQPVCGRQDPLCWTSCGFMGLHIKIVNLNYDTYLIHSNKKKLPFHFLLILINITVNGDSFQLPAKYPQLPAHLISQANLIWHIGERSYNSLSSRSLWDTLQKNNNNKHRTQVV